MLYQLVADGHDVSVVSFDYGQKHRKELRNAQLLTSILKVPWLKIDVSALGASLASALTRPEAPVPDGHYAEDSMKATIVPNRNAIMLSIAWGIAVSHHAGYVATAVHSGDHFIYPDCRPEFISRFNSTMQIANEGMMEPFVRMYTPFMHSTKAHIVKIGSMLHVPFDKTWSCYKGDAIHCGACGTCIERREAFILANIIDPTAYATLPPIPMQYQGDLPAGDA